MSFEQTLQHLEYLGYFLKKWHQEYSKESFTTSENMFFSDLVHNQHSINNWHTEQDIVQMLHHFSNELTKDNLLKWASHYPKLNNNQPSTPVLIKPLPNYCMAGFHEWLCCMVTQSPFVLLAEESQYQILKFLSRKLMDLQPAFSNLIDIGNKNVLKPKRYIIYSAKSSDLQSQYFNKQNSVIIESRPTIGILTGKETPDDLFKLGTDIFLNQGNTSSCLRKLFVPEDFDIRLVFDAIEPFNYMYRNNKYANNYDYHQSVFLMDSVKFLDNGFLIIKEDESNSAPTGCLYFEYYNDIAKVQERLVNTTYENLICTGELPIKTKTPGSSHFHALCEYPNNRDIVGFLLN